MDISLPGVNGLQATLGLREDCPQVRVLALTRHDDYGYLTEMLRAGAEGYVLKQSSSADLLGAVRAVASGQNYLDSSVTGKFISGSILCRCSRRRPRGHQSRGRRLSRS